MRLFVLILSYFLDFLELVILVYCIASWFVRPGSKLFNLWRQLGYYLYPVFKPAKMLLQALHLDRIPVDFSPWLTVILLRLVYTVIIFIF